MNGYPAFFVVLISVGRMVTVGGGVMMIGWEMLTKVDKIDDGVIMVDGKC